MLTWSASLIQVAAHFRPARFAHPVFSDVARVIVTCVHKSAL